MKNKLNNRKLTEIETDFIDFISQKTGENLEDIETKYLNIMREFHCHGAEYKELMNKIFRLNNLLYDYENPTQQINAYKHHELMLILRYLSYSYLIESNSEVIEQSKFLQKFNFRRLSSKRHTYSILNNRSLENIDINSINWKQGLAYQYLKLGHYLSGFLETPKVIVDYGSGLGYISFEVAKIIPNSKVFLVDVDSLVLEFALFRFRQNHIDVESIIVNHNNEYPELPKHNLCIATEVMEHVSDPIRIINNIKKSLSINGILFGNFEDHTSEEQHITCNLSLLRVKLINDFEMINDLTWRQRE